jgi:membrane-associated phospholipid phosphatase
VFDPGTWLGNGAFVVGSAALTYGIGRMSGRPAVTRVGAELLRAQALANLMVHSMKPVVGRTRPDTSTDNSFPSGHAAGAFAAAVVLQHSLDRKWRPLTYGVASYVAMSRMHENRHYLSDVIFGSAIGLVTGWTVTRQRVVMMPAVTRSSAGFVVAYELSERR